MSISMENYPFMVLSLCTTDGSGLSNSIEQGVFDSGLSSSVEVRGCFPVSYRLPEEPNMTPSRTSIPFLWHPGLGLTMYVHSKPVPDLNWHLTLEGGIPLS
jgi:hypothetical protein